MDSGYYSLLSGLLARSQQLDASANNAANTSTKGFRAETTYFRDTILGPNAGDSQLNRALNDYGVVGGDYVKTGQGQVTQTGNPLDVALQGPGFFAVQTAAGVRYTRAGSFMRGADGALRTPKNQVILGVNGAPIVVPPGQVDIALDGTVSVAGGVAGKLNVLDFPKGTPLSPEGDTLFRAPAQTATPALTTEVHQGSLEGSNIDAVTGATNMTLVARQFEMMQKALSIFYGDLDKTATEDLAKV
jgi:flagellar basal-body rod protein FlgF